MIKMGFTRHVVSLERARWGTVSETLESDKESHIKLHVADQKMILPKYLEQGKVDA